MHSCAILGLGRKADSVLGKRIRRNVPKAVSAHWVYVNYIMDSKWVDQIEGRAKLKTHWDEVINQLDSKIKSLDPPITRWTTIFTAQQKQDEHVGE